MRKKISNNSYYELEFALLKLLFKVNKLILKDIIRLHNVQTNIDFY